MLRELLVSANAERRELTERILALTSPQALRVARDGAEAPRGPTPSFGYDPETGHTMTVNGEERPISKGPSGRPMIPIGGQLVEAEEHAKWMDLLANECAGMGPLQRNGNGDTPPPVDPGDEVIGG